MDKYIEVKKFLKSKNCTLLSKEYKNCSSKLQYFCNLHPDSIYEASWVSIRNRKCFCKICKYEENDEKYRKITEEKGFIYDHFEFINKQAVIFFYCKNHIEKGIQKKNYQDMKRSNGKCNFCLYKITCHEDFVKYINEKFPYITILGEYIDSKTHVLCRCENCGYEWNTIPRNIINQKYGCQKCGFENAWNTRKKTNESFQKELNDLYDKNIILESDYINAFEETKFRCIKHDHVFINKPTNILSSVYACPLCYGEYVKNRDMKSNEKFVEELKIANPNIEPLEKYNGDKEKILCRCIIHNYEWKASPNKILRRNTGCPKCNVSSGENAIIKFLDDNKIKYVCQKRFPDCKDKNTLPFDFYLPNHNTCIEYDGEQHFYTIKRSKNMSDNDAENNLKTTQLHDKIKNEYCYDNNITLIRIPYWDKDNINEILKEII